MKFTQHDFDEDDWDALCRARLYYMWGVDRSSWYKSLRALGYRARSPIKENLEIITDFWLLQHPTWCEHQRRRL